MQRPTDLRSTEEELRFVHDLTLQALALRTLAEFWPVLESRLVDYFRCDRATLYLVEGGLLRSMFARGLSDAIVVAEGEGVAGLVARTKKPLVVNAPYRDARFNSGYDRKTGYKTNNLACAAFVHEDEAVGVLELLNRTGGFSAEDERTLDAFSPHVGFIIAKLRADDKNRELRETLDQAGKIAALGMLVGGVVHEVGTPMTALQAALDRLAASTPAGALKKDLENARKQSLRCQGIVKGLLQFSRRAEFELSPVSVAEQLESVLSLVRHQAAMDGVAIETDLPAGLPNVSAAPNQLQQVFLNLIVNAFHAMPGGGGRLRIAARRDGSGVRVSFKDHGQGISAADLKRLFEPFFTSRKEGTGLGLSICRDLVKRFGGTLEAKSEGKGKGAEFAVTLMAA